MTSLRYHMRSLIRLSLQERRLNNTHLVRGQGFSENSEELGESREGALENSIFGKVVAPDIDMHIGTSI